MTKQLFILIAFAACFNFSMLQPTIKCPSIFSCLFNWNKKNKVAPKNPSSVELSELFVDVESNKRKTGTNNLPTEQATPKATTQSTEIDNQDQSPMEIGQQLFQSSILRNFKNESDSSSDNQAPPAPTPSPDATPTHHFTKQDSSSPWDNIEDVL
jgi:hypothetical protein